MAELNPIVVPIDLSMEDAVIFIDAQVSPGYPSPLARIRYAMNGKKQESGLRFDLDKQVFLDHLENGQADQHLQEAAPHIARILETHRSAQLSQWLEESDAQQNLPNWNDLKAEQNLPKQDQLDNSKPK